MRREVNSAEFRRLRQEFEAQASQYPDLTLTLYFMSHGKLLEKMTTVKKPNHDIMLWQYLGNVTPEDTEDSIGEYLSFSPDKLSFVNATIEAHGVLEGPQAALFRKMAYRAGSLLTSTEIYNVTLLVMQNCTDPAWPGKPMFVCNNNPLAAWLNLVMVCVATFQPGRVRNKTLAVDPFTASLAAFDYALGEKGLIPMSSSVENSPHVADKRFKVALSFPGEKRSFVSKVASILEDHWGDIFYDYYYEAELARPNLDTLLQKIYHDNSELIVLFLCEDYERKEWCGLEWRAVRDLIKKHNDNIMLMRFDDAEISGIFSIDGYIDLRGRTSEQAADLISRRYKAIQHPGNAILDSHTKDTNDVSSSTATTSAEKLPVQAKKKRTNSEKIKAAQQLSETSTRLYNQVYSYIANVFNMSPNEEMRMIRKELNDFSDAISNCEWMFDPAVAHAARDIHDFYWETIVGIDRGNSDRQYYNNQVSMEGIGIRNATQAKFGEQQREIRGRLAAALRNDR